MRQRRCDARPGTAYLLRPDQHVCARWRQPSADALRAALLHALKEAGWVDVGRVATHDLSTKKQIYAHPDVNKKHGKSGMGDHSEYGFPSGSVKLSQITKVFYVKDGKVISEGDTIGIKQAVTSLKSR